MIEFIFRRLAVVALSAITVSSISARAQTHVDKILREESFSGYVMLFNENEGRTLRELQVRRQGNDLLFFLADNNDAVQFSLDLEKAELSQTKYPFGLAEGEPPRAYLETLKWNNLSIQLADSDVHIERVEIHFKPDNLLTEESRQFPEGMMPPLHRILFNMHGNYKIPVLQGGLYPQSDVQTDKMAKAKEMLSANYQIILLPSNCEAYFKI